jgi:hypothetical protein
MQEQPSDPLETSGGSEVCETCESIFLQETTCQLLASHGGLRFTRNRTSMLRSALDGCPLCRELLCMPYGYRAHTWLTMSPEVRDYFKTSSYYWQDKWSHPKWPLGDWASRAAKAESPSSLSFLRLPPQFARILESRLHFTIRGDVSRKNFVRITRNQRFRFPKSLLFEVSALSSMRSNPFDDAVLQS